MSSCAVIPGHRYEPASQLLTSCSQSELARQDSTVKVQEPIQAVP